MPARPNGPPAHEAPTATGALNARTGHLDTPAADDLMAAVEPAGAALTVVNEVTTGVRRHVSDPPHRPCPTSPLLLFQTIKASILSPVRFA